MEHRFCLDEILGKVSEMINDGYARAFFLSSFVCVLSRASGRLCKAFYSSLVFKVGGWGKIPQN